MVIRVGQAGVRKMSDSIVITSHNDPGTCYLTAFAVRAQVPEAEILVVADGGTEYKWEKKGFKCLRGCFGSPQASRDAGVRAASGEHVLVLESHVVVNDPRALLYCHRELGGALTFPVRIAEGPDMLDVFAHETDWDGSLWYKRLRYSPVSADLRPHRVSQFGNSCFVLDREWYIKSGGYTKLFDGWGGEEPFICLKAWMLGRECWQVPEVWHAHHLSFGQGISRPNLAHNLQVLGYLIAGRDCPGVTPAMIEERRRIQSGPFGGDVDRLKKHLESIGVR